MIPSDPIMLLSFINLKLRDYYSSLEALGWNQYGDWRIGIRCVRIWIFPGRRSRKNLRR